MGFASVSWINGILMSLQVTLCPLVKVSHSQPIKMKVKGAHFSVLYPRSISCKHVQIYVLYHEAQSL